MSIPLKQQRRVSLRKCALHNSYYAKELLKSRREVSRLTERIKELEKERVQYREQASLADARAAAEAARADGLLQFGFKEETIKADIKKLQYERAKLGYQVEYIEEVIRKLKITIRQIRIQDTNHQIKKQRD